MRKLILSAVALSGLTAAAFAQNTNTTTGTGNSAATGNSMSTGNSNAPANQTMTPAPSAATATPAQGPNFVNLQSTDMLSSNVAGLDIYNGQNDSIGKIQDVAFDDAKKVTGYILSVGGFLGMGTHYVAVDPNSLAITYDANNKTWRATMNATKDQLKNAPEFKYGGQWTASRS